MRNIYMTIYSKYDLRGRIAIESDEPQKKDKLVEQPILDAKPTSELYKKVGNISADALDCWIEKLTSRLHPNGVRITYNEIQPEEFL